MRRKSTRSTAKAASPEKTKEEKPPKKSRRTRRQKRSSSESDSDDDTPIAQTVQHHSDDSKGFDDDGGAQQQQHGRHRGRAVSGTPERTSKRLRKKSLTLPPEEDEEKSTRRSKRRGGTPKLEDINEEDVEEKRAKGKSKGKNKSKIDTTSQISETEIPSDNSENAQVTAQSPHIDNVANNDDADNVGVNQMDDGSVKDKKCDNNVEKLKSAETVAVKPPDSVDDSQSNKESSTNAANDDEVSTANETPSVPEVEESSTAKEPVKTKAESIAEKRVETESAGGIESNKIVEEGSEAANVSSKNQMCTTDHTETSDVEMKETAEEIKAGDHQKNDFAPVIKEKVIPSEDDRSEGIVGKKVELGLSAATSENAKKCEEVTVKSKNENKEIAAKSKDELSEKCKGKVISEESKSEIISEKVETENVTSKMDISETSKAEDICEESKAEDISEKSKAEVILEKSKPEDISEKSKAEDTSEKSKAEGTSEKSKAENSSEKSKDEDTSEKSKAEDISEKSKAEDVSKKSEAEEISENSKAEEEASGRSKTEILKEVCEKSKLEVLEKSKADEQPEKSRMEVSEEEVPEKLKEDSEQSKAEEDKESSGCKEDSKKCMSEDEENDSKKCKSEEKDISGCKDDSKKCKSEDVSEKSKPEEITGKIKDMETSKKCRNEDVSEKSKPEETMRKIIFKKSKPDECPTKPEAAVDKPELKEAEMDLNDSTSEPGNKMVEEDEKMDVDVSADYTKPPPDDDDDDSFEIKIAQAKAAAYNALLEEIIQKNRSERPVPELRKINIRAKRRASDNSSKDWDFKLNSRPITSDVFIGMYPELSLLNEKDVKLEQRRDRRPTISEHERKAEEQQQRTSESREAKETTAAAASAAEVSVENIIAMNRKISIVDDDASKLKPPPSPAKNERSEVLYITNLVRPFTIKQLRELLERTGNIKEEGFWTDRIKSKCYVQYQTVEEAEATRNALHGVHWPICNGKKLIIDYSTAVDLETAKNPPPVVPVAPAIPEKENQEPDITSLKKGHKDQLDLEKEAKLKANNSWEMDSVKEEAAHVRRSRSKDRMDKRRYPRSRQSRSSSEDYGKKKQKKAEEIIPQRAMDDLFRKTEATPCIYWQPLSPEEIALKQQQRLERMAEHKRRMETQTRNKRGPEHSRGGGPYRRRY